MTRPHIATLIPAAVAALIATTPVSVQAQDAPGEDVMIVFDGSNSMWGQIDGVAKIEIARDVMKNLLGEWTAERHVGLMAYGHRRRGDCTDIETLITPAPGMAAEIQARINAITPTGKTPLTDAVEQAAQALSYTDRPATVVLISDGLESCDRDPCALAKALEKGGVGFTAHVVGFGLGTDDAASLACIANETGGQFIEAENAGELATALSTLSTAVAAAPVPAPTPAPEPTPEPEAPQITLTAPATALTGANFDVAWDRIIEPRDSITIVPMGAKDDVYTHTMRVRDDMSGTLRALSTAGLYEIRYRHYDTGAVLGRAPIELLEPEVTITAPTTTLTGANFDVSWTGGVHPQDYVTIVAMGADEGAYTNYVRIHGNTAGEGTLRAPAETGLYEIRYMLDMGPRTLARQSIEVTLPEVTVSGPTTALAGSQIEVSWTGNVASQDFVTIVPMGADEGKYTHYIRVHDKSEGNLQVPSETGMYELRYVLSEGGKTLASQPLEVTAPEVTVSGPATALAGSQVEVSWTGNVASQDFVTIVPMGADEGKYTHYIRVHEKSEGDLQMPSETGMYELRYVLSEGARTLASQPLEVTAPEVTVSGPATALAGSQVEVSWTGNVAPQDFVTIVPMGADEGKYTHYIRVHEKSEGDLQMPSETGLYELRYVLSEGARTLARHTLEVTAPEVTVSGPDQIRAGDKINITWTGAVTGQDYIRIAPMGSADDTNGDNFRVHDKTEGTLSAPDQPGLYELRYTLNEGAKVLARHTIEVLAADAALNSGAALDAPDRAAAGSTIAVSWSVDATSADQRITIALADQAIFTWITALPAADGPPVQMTLPDAPGVYELRFLDVSNQAVLARKVITVE
ncbi:VWA domain-containing protein [Rhodobacteraceae bacterium KMM 6894]|nr:VWA domain-containing protein [Rhodobacteraceae bacterium KMM 6894]